MTKIKVFPNPANQVVTVQVDPALVHGKLTFIDGVGREVRQQSISAVRQKVLLNDLPAGIYYLRVEMGSLRQQATLILQP